MSSPSTYLVWSRVIHRNEMDREMCILQLFKPLPWDQKVYGKNVFLAIVFVKEDDK